MPQAQQFKVGLSGARFPLLSSWASQAVLVPAMDQVQRTQFVGDVGDQVNKDLNVPEIIYGENFVPTQYGVRSVCYQRVAQAFSPAPVDFDQILSMRDSDENLKLLSPAAGKNYVYNFDTAAWTTLHPLSNILAGQGVGLSTGYSAANSVVTSAYIEGFTFVCYSRLVAGTTGAVDTNQRDVSLYTWDPINSQLALVPLKTNSGIVFNFTEDQIAGGWARGTIDGVSASNGYLLLWSGLTIFWAPYNSTESSFDFQTFANGAFTGAGSEIPEDLAGPIKGVVSVSGGFIIFTTKNAVAAYYNQQNIQNPWTFRRIPDAGGIESLEQVSVDSLAGSVIAYTTAGLQQISLQDSQQIHPDVSLFLASRQIEFFDPFNYLFTGGVATTDLYVKVTQIKSRFLVVSYGGYPGIFSYALIYDNALKRWGKLRMVHKDCFEFTPKQNLVELTVGQMKDVSAAEIAAGYTDTVETNAMTNPFHSVAFLQKDGTVALAVMDMYEKEGGTRDPWDTSVSFVLIGKLQFSRSRYCALHSIQVTQIDPDADCQILLSYNGQYNETLPVAAVLRSQTLNFTEFGVPLVEALDFTVFLKGYFDLNTLIFKAQPTGDR